MPTNGWASLFFTFWGINPPCCSHWSVVSSLYPADGPNLHQLVADVDDVLFAQANEHHVLQQECYTFPYGTCHKWLRSRRHSYTLNIKTDYDDRNFITRLLYKDIIHVLTIYVIRFSSIFPYFLYIVQVAFRQLFYWTKMIMMTNPLQIFVRHAGRPSDPTASRCSA